MIPIIYELAEAARASCFSEPKSINRHQGAKPIGRQPYTARPARPTAPHPARFFGGW